MLALSESSVSVQNISHYKQPLKKVFSTRSSLNPGDGKISQSGLTLHFSDLKHNFMISLFKTVFWDLFRTIFWFFLTQLIQGSLVQAPINVFALDSLLMPQK